MKRAPALLLLLLPWLGGACVSRIAIDHRRCPCTTEEVCCATLDACLKPSQTCPSGDAGNPVETEDRDASCGTGPSSSAELIDDMEHATAVPSGYPAGIWFLANDETASASQQPAVSLPPLPVEILGGRCESRRGLHTWGTGFLGWGAELGLVLRVEQAPDGEDVSMPIDASEYVGLRFFARVGPATNPQLLVALGDVNTVPEGGVCGVTSDGPDRRCYNMYAKALEIGSEWAEYRVLFSELTQAPDWGHRTSALVRSQLYALNFEFQVSAQAFDFWIDDVAWLR